MPIDDLNKEQKILEAKKAGNALDKAAIANNKSLASMLDKMVESHLRGNRAREESRRISKLVNETIKKRKKIEEEYTNKLEKSKKEYQAVLIESKKLIKYRKTEGKDFKDITKKRTKQYRIGKKEQENIKKAYESQLEVVNKEITARQNLFDLHEKYYKDNILFIKNEKAYDDALEERLVVEEKILEARKAAENISEEDYKTLKKEIRGEENVAKIREDLEEKTSESEAARERYRKKLKGYLPSKGAPREKKEKALEFVKQERFDLAKEMGGKLKTLRSARGIGGHLEAAKGIGETVNKFKDLSKILGGVGAEAKGAAGMFGVLRTGMEMLGKIGWIGLIISAVAAVIKAVNELNNFIKKFNKSFIKMYGPTIAMKNVTASMKTFTDAVFDMNRNLKYGLKSEDITGLFEAMSAGGLSLQGVGKRVRGGYNEVILEATKLSRDFGVDLSEMGSMIADQMVNLKASLDEVRDSMEAMAYDATIVGISSQKFYEAVTAATDALGYYGNYLKSTSFLLKTFAERGAMPFKDAAKEAQDIMGIFKGMDIRKKLGFIQIVGDPKVKEDMARRAELIKEETQLLEDKIAATQNIIDKTKDAAKKEEYIRQKGALEDQKREKERIRRRLQMAVEGDSAARAASLGYMADRTVDYLITALKRAGGGKLDLFNLDDVMAKATILRQTADVPEEALNKLVDTSAAILADAEESAEFITSSLKDIGPESRAALKDVMAGYVRDIELGKSINEDDIRASLLAFQKSGGKIGMSIDRFIDEFKKNAFVLDASISGTGMDMKVLSEKWLTANASIIGGSKEQDKRLQDITKNTKTFEEFIGIGKENMEYMAAMAAGGDLQNLANNAMIATANTAGGILGLLQKWIAGKKGEYKTDEEFKKGHEWGDLISASKRQVLLTRLLYKAQQKYDKTQNASDKEQVDLIQAEIAKLEDLKGTLSEVRPDLAAGAVMEGTKQAQDLLDQRERSKKTLAYWEGRVKDAGAKVTETEKASLEYAKKQLASTYMEGTSFDVGGKKFGIDVSQVEKEEADAGSIPSTTAKDFRALTSGFAKITKGDWVIGDTSQAKGIMSGSGQLTNRLLGYNKGAISGGTSVSVPINLQIGYVIGNPDELVNKLTPAIEQTFARMYFEKEKRGA